MSKGDEYVQTFPMRWYGDGEDGVVVGLTKRELFAMEFLKALISNPKLICGEEDIDNEAWLPLLRRRALQQATLLLEELEKEES